MHFPIQLHWNDFGWLFYELVVVAGVALWAVYQRWASFSWPEVEATVEQYRDISLDGNQKNARHGFAYAYAVESEYYAGELAVSRRWDAKTEEDVERLYPKGSRLRVRYRPRHPETSVALPIEIRPNRCTFRRVMIRGKKNATVHRGILGAFKLVIRKSKSPLRS